jgi:uncharacterized membrane protein YhaH (DUF805 family)
MRMWISPRLRRGDYVTALIVLNVAYMAGSYFLEGAFDLKILVGFRSSLEGFRTLSAQMIALQAGFDLLVVWCIARRIQDANYPGWIVLALLALPLVLGSVGALLGLVFILAAFFLPGTIGPNRFGLDPRGWKSQEHFAEQQERLKSGNL